MPAPGGKGLGDEGEGGTGGGGGEKIRAGLGGGKGEAFLGGDGLLTPAWSSLLAVEY